jgi:translation initiation factor 2B subunit (eIF-2B alpha/beta/delta family)
MAEHKAFARLVDEQDSVIRDQGLQLYHCEQDLISKDNENKLLADQVRSVNESVAGIVQEKVETEKKNQDLTDEVDRLKKWRWVWAALGAAVVETIHIVLK